MAPSARGDFVVRATKGPRLTEPDDRRWGPGEEGLAEGLVRWCPAVRYGLHHGPPRDLTLNVALCWRAPRSRATKKPPKEPWPLDTGLTAAARAVRWY